MKVLSLSYCFPNNLNPAWGIFVGRRLSALSKREDLRICSPTPWFPALTARRGDPGPKMDAWDGITLYRPRFFYLPVVLKAQDARFYFWGIRNWFKELHKIWPVDILDAHFVWPDGAAVQHLAREFGLPYVVTLRGKLYECLKDSSMTRQCASALTAADAVVCVSRGLAEEAKKLGVSDNKLFFIPNGIDSRQLFPRDKVACRRALNLPENGKIIVTVAHLGHRKGHREVISALASLAPDVRLVIVGGPAQGGSQQTLLSVAEKAGVADRLTLPGPQPHDKVPLYFAAADVSVLASYREGCPNVVLESLACGTPVVASDVGAVRDILPDPECGRIVPPRDVDQLREALDDVLSKKWLAEDVVRTSRVKSWDEAADDVQKVFKKIFSLDHA